MKRIIYLLMFLLCIAFASASVYDDNLEIYIDCENRVTNQGTGLWSINNTGVTYQSGKVPSSNISGDGGSYSCNFSGANNYIDIGEPSWGNYTISLFFWMRDIEYVTNNPSFVANFDTSNWYFAWGIDAASGCDWIRHYERRGDATTVNPTSSECVSDGNWHHAAAVAHRAGSIDIYLDGGLVGTAGTTNNADYDFAQTTLGMIIGEQGNNEWEDLLDEIKVYNMSLSAQNILDIVNYGSPQSSDTTPPTLSAYNITSVNVVAGQPSNLWATSVAKQENVTSNLLSITFTTDENANCSCRTGTEQNYTEMVAADANYKLSTTTTTYHSYTVYDDLSLGSQCLYCSCIDESGNEPASGDSQSECMNISRRDHIVGTVYDNSSNVIPGALVYIIEKDTNITENKTSTDAFGNFSYTPNQIGLYFISVFSTNYTLEPSGAIVNITG